MLPELVQLVLWDVRRLISVPCDVWIRQFTCLLLVHVNLHSGTLKQLLNAWLMNLSMQQRVHLTGNQLFLLILFTQFLSTIYNILSFTWKLIVCPSIFSYAIKKKDEIERVAKANRWRCNREKQRGNFLVLLSVSHEMPVFTFGHHECFIDFVFGRPLDFISVKVLNR